MDKLTLSEYRQLCVIIRTSNLGPLDVFILCNTAFKMLDKIGKSSIYGHGRIVM